MFDVFFLNQPTGLFVHEQHAESIEHAREMSRTRYLWIVDNGNDYSQFDWHWEPPPWQAHQAHVWPSQHQENGGTWLVPRHGYSDINRQHAIVPRRGTWPRIHIMHSGQADTTATINTRYIHSYLGTIRRALQKIESPYCWVTSDVCDYHDFDWTWHPSEWQLDLLHVFASSGEKFGDTFLVHTPSFLERCETIKDLEHYPGLNFLDLGVKRLPVPCQHYSDDSVVDAIWRHDFDHPVVQFYQTVCCPDPPTVSLWQDKMKNVVSLSSGGSTVLVPRECKNHLSKQVYDYPYISKQPCLQEPPLDIVYISNGEVNAERNWQWLLENMASRNNRVHRVDGVKGRRQAYQAALEVSDTLWAFCVFAKLQIDSQFDWSWQPDRLQEAKHYIFHALNATTGLEYGHMGMIAYNKKLVMCNAATGLDFTLDQPHEVVPIRSGLAQYTDDPWMAWRTAFREALKLRHSLPDVENAYRLQRWCNTGMGPNGVWSAWGAQDAMEYYDDVDGAFDKLKLSYEWEWLASYALMKRNLVPGQ